MSLAFRQLNPRLERGRVGSAIGVVPLPPVPLLLVRFLRLASPKTRLSEGFPVQRRVYLKDFRQHVYLKDFRYKF